MPAHECLSSFLLVGSTAPECAVSAGHELGTLCSWQMQKDHASFQGTFRQRLVIMRCIGTQGDCVHSRALVCTALPCGCSVMSGILHALHVQAAPKVLQFTDSFNDKDPLAAGSFNDKGPLAAGSFTDKRVLWPSPSCVPLTGKTGSGLIPVPFRRSIESALGRPAITLMDMDKVSKSPAIIATALQ
eukprot:1143736-Pelagomonas_calceolata.AAC.3